MYIYMYMYMYIYIYIYILPLYPVDYLLCPLHINKHRYNVDLLAHTTYGADLDNSIFLTAHQVLSGRTYFATEGSRTTKGG